MTAKVNLDLQSILDKEFNVDFKGYNADEVDQFLDLVLQDYQTYQEAAAQAEDKIQDLEKTNASLRAKVMELEGAARANSANPPATAAPTSNVDILKRLSRLEDEVFVQKRNS